MLLVAFVVTVAVRGIALLLSGEPRADLSPQSFILLSVLVAALGGGISILMRMLQILRSYERIYLEAMSEGQVQEHVWQLAVQTKDPALMHEMTSAGERLNRGTPIPETQTNQHIEQARLEEKLASASSANALSSATAFLQDALSKKSNRKPRS